MVSGMGRSGKALAAGAALLAGTMLALTGCAAPAPLGLGGSDAAIVGEGFADPFLDEDGAELERADADALAAGTESEEPSGNDAEPTARFWAHPIDWPAGSTLTFTRVAANCMRDEVDVTWKVGEPDPFLAREFFASAECGLGRVFVKAWATWKLTVTYPDGTSEWTRFEIWEDSVDFNRGVLAVGAKCWKKDPSWGNTLRCFGDTMDGVSSKSYWEFHFPLEYLGTWEPA